VKELEPEGAKEREEHKARNVRRWQRYSAYRNSETEWLGNLPEHWTAVPFKTAFRLIYRYPTYYGISYMDSGVREIRGEALGNSGRINRLDDERYISSSTSARFPRTVVECGDIVMSVRGTMGKIGFVDDQVAGANITANLLRLSPRLDTVCGNYLKWLLLSPYFAQCLDRQAPQTTIKTVTISQLSQIVLPLPPLCEQIGIAEFLDSETARLDALVAKKQRLIELLQENRAALISQAVTKGLDPTVPMKDSGVPWLAEIPAAWALQPLGSVAHLQRGHDLPQAERRPGSVPIISSSGLCDYHDSLKAKGPGVVTGRYGTIGQVFYVEADYWPLNTSLYVCDFKGNCPRYIYYLLQLMPFDALGGKSAVPGVNRNDLHPLLVGCPAITEQLAIASHLDVEIPKIDALVAKLTTAIDKLREYRAALISAAITGKIDVRTLKDDA
jgi:type I restriction enzyme, S subunit